MTVYSTHPRHARLRALRTIAWFAFGYADPHFVRAMGELLP